MEATLELTPEQIAEENSRLRVVLAWKARRALFEAPDLLHHARAIAVSGQGEAGETLREWSAPMRIQAADDSDEAYAQLIGWTWLWAERLELATPVSAVLAWKNQREPQGFKAGTTPAEASLLTRVLSSWLISKHDQIVAIESPTVESYLGEIVYTLSGLRRRYPIAPHRQRPHFVQPSLCPACKHETVTASWWSESIRDVELTCGWCGASTDQILALTKVRKSRMLLILDRIATETPPDIVEDFDPQKEEHLELYAAREAKQAAAAAEDRANEAQNRTH